MAERSAASFFGKLRALNLPTADYAVFGSGPLAVRGLIEEVHDLDVVARGAAWEQAKGLGQVRTAPEGDPWCGSRVVQSRSSAAG